MRRGRLITGVLGVMFLASTVTATAASQREYMVAQKNRIEAPAAYTPMSHAEFLALPVIGPQYRLEDWDRVKALEARGVSIEGYIGEVIQAFDGLVYGRSSPEGDLHVHIRARPSAGCFSDEDRGKQIVTEVTPHFQPPRTGWSGDVLRDLCRRQVRVRISGWPFNDASWVKGIGDWRGSAWEIHPVTRIEVWDDAARAWRTLP